MRYDVEDSVTGKIFEIEIRLSEYDAYFEKNKNHRQVHLAEGMSSIGDPVRLGIRRVPVDFQKGVLDRIKEKVGPKGTAMKRSRWSNNINEI